MSGGDDCDESRAQVDVALEEALRHAMQDSSLHCLHGLLFRRERLLGHGIDGRCRFGVPRFEIVDDEHDAVHADPVSGKRADEDVFPRLLRRGETEAFGFALLQEFGGEEDIRAVGNECLGLGIGRHGHRSTRRSNSLQRSRRPDDEVVRHRVAVEQHDLDGFAGFDGEPAEIIGQLFWNRADANDLNTEGAKLAAYAALGFVRQLGSETLAELDGIEGPRFGASLRRDRSSDSHQRSRQRLDARRRPRAVRNALERSDRRRADTGIGVGLDLAREEFERRGIESRPAQSLRRSGPCSGVGRCFQRLRDDRKERLPKLGAGRQVAHSSQEIDNLSLVLLGQLPHILRLAVGYQDGSVSAAACHRGARRRVERFDETRGLLAQGIRRLAH